jgi:mRNA interferase MazF
MKRGDIHWIGFPPPNGHEQAGRRPAVVLQDEAVAGTLPVVLVVPLTAAVAALRFAGTVAIDPTTANGLRARSVALIFQLRAVDRQRIQEALGSVSAEDLERIFTALDTLLGRARPSAPSEPHGQPSP